jgi:hypothetical protein
MRGENSRKNFDQAERELIRIKLFQYMKRNRIGAPGLAERIQAAHPRGTEIPISTLQRFLAGRMRTNDDAVRLCHGFAESLTASDCIAALGEALSAFYDAKADRENPGKYDYSGNYFSDTGECDTASFDAETPVEPQFEITADAGFWRVIWRVIEKRALSKGSNVLEGVLVCTGDAAFVVMKDRLTGFPSSYVLSQGAEMLWGCGTSALFSPGQALSLFPIRVELRLSKTPRQGRRPVVRGYAQKLPDSQLEKGSSSMGSVTSNKDHALLQYAYDGNLELVTELLTRGVSPDSVDSSTGMSALHLAIGRNHLDIVRALIEFGASFVPDRQGRMPTVIAAECEVSEHLNDFIAEAEARAQTV